MSERIGPAKEKFRIGDFEIENPKLKITKGDDLVPIDCIGNAHAEQPSDEGWEIEAFGVSMNDRDDVYTVGAVIIIALVLYVAKLSLDHWFNKRLEIFKSKLK